ncbi:DUF262 domain-containing protein [Yersinia proxima]|uniref:DUF262 domain-containing protein n=1 Tax=Yersinia proxima TaxID=2890316 RepID=UPI001D10A58B|nr:DUF262 domain-containing protein [Yersinia proxima]
MNDTTGNIFEDIDDESYPIDEFQLTTTPNDFNILTIISFIESNVFKIPAFQRHYVWDIKRASKLIESLLIGLPIPQIFLYEKERNEFLVIDGQQRLMTLYYFFNGRFPRMEKRSELRVIFEEHGKIPSDVISDDNYFVKFNLRLGGIADGMPNRFNGKNYDTLGDAKISLNLATIRNMVIKPVLKDDEDGAMFEIFNRLNSGGMNLSPQEIRMSLYHSYFLANLISLNTNPTWRRLLGKNVVDVRLTDVEAILRVFSMAMYTDNYKSSVSGFLNTFANSTKGYISEATNFSSSVWAAFMDACSTIHEDEFKTGGNRMSITLFESVFYAVTFKSFKNHTIDIHPVTSEFIAALKANADFISFSTGKTTRKESVIGRLEKAKEIYEGQ